MRSMRSRMHIGILLTLILLAGCESKPIKGHIYDLMQDTSFEASINVRKYYVGRPLIVWRTPDDFYDGKMLLDAGVVQEKPELLVPYFVCGAQYKDAAQTVPAFTMWRRISRAWSFAGLTEVLILQGKNAGCRGFIEAQYFKPDKEQPK